MQPETTATNLKKGGRLERAEGSVEKEFYSRSLTARSLSSFMVILFLIKISSQHMKQF